jgi:hypothetical protein
MIYQMSTPEYDEWLLETSSAGAEETPMPFKSRSKITINDSNNGQYSSGQITWDLSQLANSTNMPDLKSAYLRIPYLMKLSALTGAGLTSTNGFDVSSAGASAYAMCFKGSNLSTIDSLTLEISNQNVVSLQSLSNIPITYELLTKWNDDDVAVLGPTINFEKDTAGSVRWDTSVGETNNSITSVAPSALVPESCNMGKLRRSQRGMTSALNATFAQYNNQTALNDVEISNVVESGAGFTYTVFATIPLKYLHDVFAKLPLVKGAQYKPIVNTHAPCSFTETIGAGAAVSAPVAVSQRGYIPFMTPQPSTGNSANGLRVVPANMDKLVAELSIISTCVFHCNTYELTPLYAQVYFKNPVKTVKFTDFLMNRSIININPGQSVSQFQLTAGQGRVRKLLIVPIVSASDNAGIDPLQSANTSCGMTCVPFAYMTNF